MHRPGVVPCFVFSPSSAGVVGVLKVMAVDFFLWVSRRSSGMVDYRELFPGTVYLVVDMFSN